MEANHTKFRPEHPLPEEVRTMKRDETVCKYCGVSYLIHNEIKALEEKMKKLQEELEFFKGTNMDNTVHFFHAFNFSRPEKVINSVF